MVAGDVVDVLILEAADHLHDRIDSRTCVRNLLPSPRLVAPFTRPAMSTNSIAAGDDVGPGDLLHVPAAAHPHGDHADVGVDGAERIVGASALRVRVTALNRCGLADVGETDDTSRSIMDG